MARSTYLKVGKLIKINLNDISRIPFRNSLDAFGRLLHLCVPCSVEQGIGKIECRVELPVLVGKVHGSGEGNRPVWAFKLRDGEVGRQFENALLVVV